MLDAIVNLIIYKDFYIVHKINKKQIVTQQLLNIKQVKLV